MKLLRIEVQHFGCIRSASVELGPGLNLLYGPNDLGKSTLARAVRAAFLLPHSSSAASEFAPWDSGESPEVAVTFQTESQRFYRVHKRFGDKGASFLEESKDGLTFHTEKKAREVDGRLRELLRWGIRSPGGQAAPRGLPESFLSTVLLGEQANVTSILRQTLAKDTDESGRARLTAALEAFAQDPLFKHILAQAQSKVDEAFSATGKRKRGRASPFTQVSEAVRSAKEELSRLESELRMTEETEEKLRALNAERDRLAELRDEKRALLDRVRTLAQQSAQRRGIEEQLAAARAELGHHQQQHDTAANLRAELSQAEKSLADVTAELANLDERSAAAAAELERAKEALRLRGDEAAQQRQLARSQLETKRAQLGTRVTELRGRADEVARASRLASELATARSELESANEERTRKQAEREALASRRTDLVKTRSSLELAERLARLDALHEEIGQLDELAAQVEEDRRLAASKREQAGDLLNSIPDGFPSRETLRAMEKIQQELAIAEARLGGGLSLRLRLREPLEVEARVDGTARAVDTQQGSIELDAERALSLRLGSIAEIEVSAGQPDVRAAVEAARKRHEVEVLRALAALDLPTLDALREALVKFEGQRAEAERFVRDADALEQRAAERAMRLSKLPELRSEHDLLQSELTADPVHDLARAALDDIGRTAIGSRLASLRRELAEAEKRSTVIESELSSVQARVTALEERCRNAETELGAAGPEPEGGWALEESRLRSEIANANDETVEIGRALARLDEERSATEREAERAVNEAGLAASALSREIATARETQTALSKKEALLRGQLGILEPQLASIDLEADRARVTELNARLSAHPVPERVATEVDLQHAEAEVDAADRALQAHDSELQKAKGALETVGGYVVRERVEQAREALRLAERNEREIDVEYGAWQLLVEKLRDAESTEGKHLGEALSVPVTKQFESLTSSRYGKLQLDPNLGAEGIISAGKLREIAALSVGTQEQLATLLRVTIAEQLGSMLLLDDQLTQTDPTRTAWFRTLLRDRAVNIQVIVLTCRPTAYIEADELPAAGETVRDRAAGLVRAVDLEGVVQRGATAPQPLPPSSSAQP